MNLRSEVWRLALLCCALVMVGGCAPPRFASPPGAYAYREGWHDGCASGYAVAGSPLYEQALAASPQRPGVDYEAGWRGGYNDCSDSYGRIQETIHLFFAPS
jgi:hypothetical protein